jgi:hypothetical protein
MHSPGMECRRSAEVLGENCGCITDEFARNKTHPDIEVRD